ncbi:serine/threonine protein phosphatase [Sphingomonas koreensis]|nr:serine/threonine protein phosphatase [Sphingomonas koreensis]
MTVPVLARSFEVPRRRALFARSPRIRKERIVAIGDIHGRWDLLQPLLEGIERLVVSHTDELTRLVVLGDFIDRGPGTRPIIDFLRTVQERSDRLTVLLGNHEAMLLAAISGDGDAQRSWLHHGGDATLASYGVAPPVDADDAYAFGARVADAIGPDTIDWLRDLPTSFRSGGYFFCHAGIKPGQSLNRQTDDDLLWIRGEFVNDDRDHKAVIVHGHTIVDAVQIRHNRISLDTGAYRSGILSAAVFGRTGKWIVETATSA